MLISSIILAPLVGALIILLIPARHKTAIRVTAALSTAVSLVLSVALLVLYNQAQGDLQFVELREWLPSFGSAYFVAADGMSVAMLLLTALVIFAGVFASWRLEERPKEFFLLLLILVAGVFGVFASFDLLLFFVFYELAVIPMYLLIAVWGSTKKEYAAYKLTLYLLAGSAFLMVGLLMLFFSSGNFTFNLPLLASIKFPMQLQMLLFPPLFLGFAFLVPMWPFHTWSPIGHVAAPTAVSMLHAGVLMKLGAYGIIRVALTLFPDAARVWMPLVAILATVNVLYGAMVAMAQRDLKFVVGYSSVSHMGYVLLGIASFTALGLSGAVLQMFSHGIMTGLFFSLIGLVYGKTHTRMIDELGGLAHQMPVVAVGFFIAALTSLGLPGLSSFVAELMVFFGAFKAYRFLAILSILAIVVTAAYILRAAQRVFMGPAQEKFAGLSDARTVDFVPFVLLIAVLLGVGIFPSVLVNLINTSVTPLVGKIGGLF